MVENVEIFLPVKFIEFCTSVSEGILKMSQLSNQRPGRHLGCLIGLKNTNLVEDFDILLPVVQFCSLVSAETSNMSKLIRGWGSHLGFRLA